MLGKNDDDLDGRGEGREQSGVDWDIEDWEEGTGWTDQGVDQEREVSEWDHCYDIKIAEGNESE